MYRQCLNILKLHYIDHLNENYAQMLVELKEILQCIFICPLNIWY